MEDHLQDGRREGVKRLCAEGDIAEGEGRGFVFGGGTEREAVFVIRWHGRFHGYRNSCPHVGTPLDWPENRFFDSANEFLMCGTHGAVFRPKTAIASKARAAAARLCVLRSSSRTATCSG